MADDDAPTTEVEATPPGDGDGDGDGDAARSAGEPAAAPSPEGSNTTHGAPGTHGWGRAGKWALLVVAVVLAAGAGAAFHHHHDRDHRDGDRHMRGDRAGWWGGRDARGKHGGFGMRQGWGGHRGGGMPWGGGPDMGRGDGMAARPGMMMMGPGGQMDVLRRALTDHLGVTDAKLKEAMLASVDDLLTEQKITKDQATAMKARIDAAPTLLSQPATAAPKGT